MIPGNKTLNYSCKVVAEDIESHLSSKELQRIKGGNNIHKDFSATATLDCEHNPNCTIRISFRNDPVGSKTGSPQPWYENPIIAAVIGAITGGLLGPLIWCLRRLYLRSCNRSAADCDGRTEPTNNSTELSGIEIQTTEPPTGDDTATQSNNNSDQ